MDGAAPVSVGPFTSKNLYNTALSDKIEPRGTQKTQPHTATVPTHQVLPGAPFLHALGARMTVVELTPSNINIYIYIYITR